MTHNRAVSRSTSKAGPRSRPRARTWTFLLAVGTGLMAGCGGGGSSSDTAPDRATDESGIRGAVTTYVSSMAAQDGEGACAVMTKGLQKQLMDAASAGAAALRGKSCPELLNLVTEQGGSQVQRSFDAAKKGKITNIKVTGDRATLVSEASLGGRVTRVRYEAQRVGGRWLISCCLASG